MTPTGLTDLDVEAPSILPMLGVEPQATSAVPPPAMAIGSRDYEYYKRIISQLIGAWNSGEKIKVENRRDLRRVAADIKQAKSQGTLLEDETLINDHTIDANVRVEKPPYMDYISTSRTALTFTPLSTSDVESASSAKLVESWFTKGVRHTRWKQPWYKIIDANCFHGAIYYEVVFDVTKPLHTSIDYIPREQLILPMDVMDIQACEVVPRLFKLTVMQLEAWIQDAGFNGEVLKPILSERESDRIRTIEVYKILFKQNNVVMIGWYHEAASTWIKDPIPLDIGLRQPAKEQPEPQIDPMSGQLIPTPPIWEPAPVMQYPYVPLLYQAVEDERVLFIPGRAFIDAPVQEAISRILTSTVNGAFRASRFYPTRTPNAASDTGNRTVSLKHGVITEGDISVFQPAWPNAIALNLIGTLSIRNKEAMGKSDYASMQRGDATPVTATQIVAAQDATKSLSTMQIALLSDSYLESGALQFEIARSQALAGELGNVDPLILQALQQKYILAPSGDIEVVKRAETLAQLKELLPLFVNTPAAMTIIKKIVELAFPDDAASIIQELDGPNKDAIVAQLSDMLLKTAKYLPEQDREDLYAVVRGAQSVVTPSNNGPNPGQDAANPASPTKYSGSPDQGSGQGEGNGEAS
jgi:hypothetical protein